MCTQSLSNSDRLALETMSRIIYSGKISLRTHNSMIHKKITDKPLYKIKIQEHFLATMVYKSCFGKNGAIITQKLHVTSFWLLSPYIRLSIYPGVI